MVRADATVGDFVQVGANATVSRLIGDVNVTYDKIGNIKTMHRTAKNPITTNAPYTTLQHWNYGYQNGTNRLQYANGLSGTATRAYTYDANGNVLTDNSKNLTATEYGRAAYPFKLTMGNETETYLYSVDDQRIYKRNVGFEQNPEEDYYLLDVNGKTIAILHTTVNSSNWEYFASGAEREVRIIPQGSAAISVNEASFYIYDHLGNTRVTYTPTFQNDPDLNVNFLKITVNSVVDYFPYGKVLRHLNASDERYLTTQHERDESTGLDYRGARYYDSDLGRFLSLDPHAKDYASWSAYSYVNGNPMLFIDSDGKDYHPWEQRTTEKVIHRVKDNGDGTWTHTFINKQTWELKTEVAKNEYKIETKTIVTTSIYNVSIENGMVHQYTGSWENERTEVYESSSLKLKGSAMGGETIETGKRKSYEATEGVGKKLTESDISDNTMHYVTEVLHLLRENGFGKNPYTTPLYPEVSGVNTGAALTVMGELAESKVVDRVPVAAALVKFYGIGVTIGSFMRENFPNEESTHVIKQETK